MSHHTHDTIVCPNCGSEAKGNYCYQCGQETHLHKETFRGLVGHFLAHYFHYDSKFWKTINALWFSPGKLTLAYWNKQRMRYIPPISLYIFISAIYFLIGFSIPQDNGAVRATIRGRDSTLDLSKVDLKQVDAQVFDTSNQVSGFQRYINRKALKMREKDPGVSLHLKDKLDHMWPKIMFFMIPVMALLLKILYFRRKDLYFVDHAIFSLHYHCFWFSIMVLKYIDINNKVSFVLRAALYLTAFIYLTTALTRVYKTHPAMSVLNTVLVAAGYIALLGVAIVVCMLLLFVLA